MSLAPESGMQIDQDAQVISAVEAMASHCSMLNPEDLLHMPDLPREVRFRTAQLGMIAASDWRIRAEWQSVLSQAAGSSDEF